MNPPPCLLPLCANAALSLLCLEDSRRPAAFSWQRTHYSSASELCLLPAGGSQPGALHQSLQIKDSHTLTRPGDFGSSSQVKARLIVEKWCCEEAVSCKILASTALVGLFSTAMGARCPAVPGELLEPNRRVMLELQKLWLGQCCCRLFESNDYLIAAALNGSKHTTGVECCEEHILPLQQHEALTSGKVFLASLGVGSPCQCSSFILGHSFSHIKVLRKAFCLALLHLF